MDELTRSTNAKVANQDADHTELSRNGSDRQKAEEIKRKKKAKKRMKKEKIRRRSETSTQSTSSSSPCTRHPDPGVDLMRLA